MDFWSSLEALRARHDVLRHPFYLRWSAGELTRGELAHYSGQYRHAVLALADAAANAASAVDASRDPQLRAQLKAHAAEEAEHVALWDEFCAAVGGARAAAPNPETEACARAWAGDRGRPLLHSLVALHAIESAQPAIAATKRIGLATHYGLADGAGAAYFELHERRDVEHAAASRELIAQRLERPQPQQTPQAPEAAALLDEAEAVLRGNWLLLDGVERASTNAPR